MVSPRSVLERDRAAVWSRERPHVEEVVSADFVLYDRSSPSVIYGRSGYRQYVSAYRSAVPDMTATVETAFASEGWVASISRIEGTFRSSFMGVPATGRQVVVEMPFFARVHGDRMIAAATPGWEVFARQLSNRNPPLLAGDASSDDSTEYRE